MGNWSTGFLQPMDQYNRLILFRFLHPRRIDIVCRNLMAVERGFQLQILYLVCALKFLVIYSVLLPKRILYPLSVLTSSPAAWIRRTPGCL